MSKTNVICIVPVKNESWILKNFIECALVWADFIIVGDNNSTDDSVSIARRFKSVKVIPLGPSFDEENRRRRLINEARKIPGSRLIFSMDADEMISANWSDSPEWGAMLNAQPGTKFLFDWVELLPGLDQCAIYEMPTAFVDDGTEYQGKKMHSSRVPATAGELVKLKNIKLLHYINIEPERMFSKHRWYKCIEYIDNGKRPWSICITYQDRKIKIYNSTLIPVRSEWLKGYEWLNQYRAIREISGKCYWYDEEVLNLFDKYGTDRFRKINIWDIDWKKKADSVGRKGNYEDPRSSYEIWVHKFIEKYREELKLKKNLPIKLANLFAGTALRTLGW